LLEKISGIPLPQDGADVDEQLYLTPEQALQGGPYAYYLRSQSKKLVVKIPPGVRPGQRIRLAGMGQEGKGGGKPGDLFLKVHVRKPLMKSIKDLFSKLILR
jgi:curved DNA-binding protein CbpA